MSAHTPGPWVTHSNAASVQGPQERVAKYWQAPGTYQIIADCSHAATGGTDREANARLIAAAPDLLACLKEALGEIECEGFIADRREAAKRFAAAIANAEGRP